MIQSPSHWVLGLYKSQQPRDDDDNVEEDPSRVNSDTGSRTGEILITYGVAH